MAFQFFNQFIGLGIMYEQMRDESMNEQRLLQTRAAKLWLPMTGLTQCSHKVFRRWIYLLTLYCFLGLAVQAQSFAALTVTPSGSQVFDISTGVTTMPEGGAIIDKEANLQLVAGHIRYEETNFIEARQVSVQGRFGNLQAENIYVDIAAQTIQAFGSLALAYQSLELTAETLTIYLQPDVMVLETVISSQPSFNGQMLIVQLERAQALLVAPYSFQDGPVTLRQSGAGQLLQLSQQEVQGSLRFAASTTIQDDLLAELSAYLPEQ